MADPATEAFDAHRTPLFTVAHEMLGSAADAEDVLRETWLRRAGAGPGEASDPRAYLVRVTTRQALGRLRAAKRRREAYVGPWLPGPLVTAPDVAEGAELAESLSMAMTLVLESLSPTERAVFVLREVFGVDDGEIAEAVGRSPGAVREIAHRARRHVGARRPRGTASAAETRAALESFRRAVETGDSQGLLDVLAPDVVLLSDGGGLKRAAPRPVVGAEKIVRFRLGGSAEAEGALTWEPTAVDGSPAPAVRVAGEPDAVMAVRVEEGRVSGLYLVRAPEKLTHLAAGTPLGLR
ncbi:RNA polymerase sigma-70 factor [Streptomyces roseofulvus]|uniref:RNA polymerase sigma factor SigJ n=1 Tax=Streptomyces roseofulvus TaxID=33902 RepID=UPI0031FC0817